MVPLLLRHGVPRTRGCCAAASLLRPVARKQRWLCSVTGARSKGSPVTEPKSTAARLRARVVSALQKDGSKELDTSLPLGYMYSPWIVPQWRCRPRIISTTNRGCARVAQQRNLAAYFQRSQARTTLTGWCCRSSGCVLGNVSHFSKGCRRDRRRNWSCRGAWCVRLC